MNDTDIAPIAGTITTLCVKGIVPLVPATPPSQVFPGDSISVVADKGGRAYIKVTRAKQPRPWWRFW